MNTVQKNLIVAMLTCLCVWLGIKLMLCETETSEVIQLNTRLEYEEREQLNDAFSEVQQFEDEDVLVPLSVNYSGHPIHPMYDSGFKMNNDVCSVGNTSPELLIIIHSVGFHFDQRTAIRYTWKNFSKKYKVAMIFFIGRSANGTLTDYIRKEASVYGDIVVSNIVDTYNNLTLKTISMCEWVHRFCPRAKFVLKSDDDVFLNVPLLIDYIRKPEVSSAKRSVFGKVNHGTGPIRYPASKFYVSYEEYPGNIYPDYMQGASYLFTGDIAGQLFRTALKMDFFRMEDVFMTGLVAERIRARKFGADRFYIIYFEMGLYVNDKVHPVDPCDVKKTVAIHYARYDDIFALWHHLFHRTVCE